MGKSDKKVKSDRVNALRKQYDAFLEDDKKRKERNEYILEHLDKMRYCTAMVQVRQKVPFSDSRKIANNLPQLKLDSPPSSPLDIIPRNNVDENILLREISKKYILIPKLRSTNDDEFTDQIKSKVDENADWKSKYDILNKLKRDEKEQDCSPPQVDCMLEPSQDRAVKTYLKENNYVEDENTLLQYKNELPVKLAPESETPYELQNYYQGAPEIDQDYNYGNQFNDTTTTDSLNQNISEDSVFGANSIKNINIDYNPANQSSANDNAIQNIDYEINNTENAGLTQPELNGTDYDQIPSKDNTEYLNIQEDYLNTDTFVTKTGEESMQLLEPNENTTLDTSAENAPQYNETSGQLTVTSEPINNEQYVLKEEENNNTVEPTYINQEGTVLMSQNNETIGEDNNVQPTEINVTMNAANIEYPIEMANVQDLNTKDDVQLKENININPEPEVLVSDNVTYDPVVIDNANTPGETDAFYNEQTGSYDYTTEGVENYNTEYAPPTEHYQQNEEYAYYEGAQQEQPYTEINEHVETTEQYDQNYEQQYGTAYDQEAYQQQEYQQEYAQGHDDQQDYTQPPQQYEVVDQTQQDLQYENEDNSTPQYVEQQLDNEEGYIVDTEQTEGKNVETQQISASAEKKATVS